MRRKKRAQAAMEFLMTYGWAILVVLVVIGALAYFGIFNPKTIAPERCVFAFPFECRGSSITDNTGATDEIKLSLYNAATRNVIFDSSAASSNYLGGGCTAIEGGTALINSGELGTVTINNCELNAGAKGEKAKVTVELNYAYSDTPTFKQKIVGEIINTIQ